MRKMWVRRTKIGALEAARWSAFRRYLEDFSRLEEAPPIAIGLWEEYLVYAIALGVAEDVLEAARLRAPEVLEDESSLYWYGNHGFGGHSSNAISGIERALVGCVQPAVEQRFGRRLLRRWRRRRRRGRRRRLVGARPRRSQPVDRVLDQQIDDCCQGFLSGSGLPRSPRHRPAVADRRWSPAPGCLWPIAPRRDSRVPRRQASPVR